MNAPVTTSPPVREVVTPAGLVVWHVHETGLPLLALDFAFVGGAAQDPPGKPGAVNLIAGLLDEGAGTLDSEAFQARLADRAIELHFGADRDDFRGSLKTLTRHRAEAAELLALALQQPRFDAEALARVKAQVGASLRREQQDPDAVARNAFAAAAFPDHPYGRPVRGTLESLEGIDRDDLKALAARLFVRDRLCIVAVGDITEAEVAALVDQVFAPLPKGEAGAPDPLAAVPKTTIAHLGEIRIVAMDVPQTSLRYGAPALYRDDPDYIPAEIVNHILGGSAFTSRLFMEVREKRGLAYGVSSGLMALRAAAIHVGATATKNDRVAESLAVMREQMALLATEGPTEQELDEAKSYLIGSFPLRFDTSSKIASQLLSFAVLGLGIDYVARRNALFAAVTMDDVRRAAQRLYGEGRLLVVAVGQPIGLA